MRTPVVFGPGSKFLLFVSLSFITSDSNVNLDFLEWMEMSCLHLVPWYICDRSCCSPLMLFNRSNNKALQAHRSCELYLDWTSYIKTKNYAYKRILKSLQNAVSIWCASGFLFLLFMMSFSLDRCTSAKYVCMDLCFQMKQSCAVIIPEFLLTYLSPHTYYSSTCFFTLGFVFSFLLQRVI